MVASSASTRSSLTLTWLEQRLLARDADAGDARRVACDFDAFVDLVAAGGEGADDFLSDRARAEAASAGDGVPRSIEVRFVTPPARE